MCRGIYINRVFSGSHHIGCSSHCLCVCNDYSDHPSFLSIETPGILEDESSLKNRLSGPMKTAWVGGGGNLWRRESGRD